MRNAWWTRWRGEGFVETASADDADLVILNTCHIREKASEKVYSELGRLRVAKDEAARNGRADEHRGRRLRRAGRGRGDHPPRAGGRRRGRPAELSSSAAAAGARQKPRPRAGDRISGRGQVRLPAAAEAGGDPRARHFVVRHRAGRLRQVLHLLRGALYARRGSLAPGRKDHRRRDAARRQWRARNHADRPERQRLSRRRPGRPDLAARQAAASPRRNPRHRAPALFDQPSPRRRRHA